MSLRILYIGKHGQVGTSNDDEGAITFALAQMGHFVTPVKEADINNRTAFSKDFDLCLFHKWFNPAMLARISYPKVFWNFDLVEYPQDPTLTRRDEARRAWMRVITPLVDLGFCTDGDWVAKDTTGKLFWLTQGADARIAGSVGCGADAEVVPVLFTGSVLKCGTGRQEFVKDMRRRYTRSFTHVENGVHGLDLARLIGRSCVVVAPPEPATDMYWSNRVYLTLGFGGFLLHPECKHLKAHYDHGKELVFYHDWRDLVDKIGHYTLAPGERKPIADAGLARTRAEHLYTHRVTRLLDICRERRLIP